MDLDGSSLISFIIHGGFLTVCPNTAVEPAAVKHSDTPFPPRGGGGEGRETSAAEVHRPLPHFEANHSKYFVRKVFF